MDKDLAESNWDKVYNSGDKYQGAPPLPFVRDIIKHVGMAKLAQGRGLYIGCGNGRNYLELAKAGLTVIGLDISSVALQQLSQKIPDASDKLVHADFLSYQSEDLFDYIVSIQVFQHGNWIEAQELFAKVNNLLRVGGLFFLRVKSAKMPTKDPHYIIEQTFDGGFTAHFTADKKQGLDIHYYSVKELRRLIPSSWAEIVSPHEVIERHSNQSIRRSHLQAIWRKQ